jgi:hypothetical protein
MRTLVGAYGLVVALSALGAAGCAMGQDDDVLGARVAALNADSPGGTLPLCRWMEDSLRGKEAAIYPVRENDYYVSVSMHGAPVCVDTVLAVYREGVEPSTDGNDPACTYCEGTPLPADKLLELVKKYEGGAPVLGN